MDKLVIIILLIFLPLQIAKAQRNSDSSKPNAFCEGPWNINAPVHETLTQISLIDAGITQHTESFEHPEVWEYIRGAIWNDDPDCLFFDEDGNNTKNWSSGFRWYKIFSDCKKHSHEFIYSKNSLHLLGRSHFGDMSFLHSMAANNGEQAGGTLCNIIMWMEFTYKVAIKNIQDYQNLKDIILSNQSQKYFDKLFKDDKFLSNRTVKQFFGCNLAGDVKKRAIGSLLHLIQDSYTKSHTERNWNGDITIFYSYKTQNEDEHKSYDGWGYKDKGNLRQRIENFPDSQKILEKCTNILRLYKQHTKWEDVEHYVRQKVFPLAENVSVSGPGKKFDGLGCGRSVGNYGFLCRNSQKVNRHNITLKEWKDLVWSSYGLCSHYSIWSKKCQIGQNIIINNQTKQKIDVYIIFCVPKNDEEFEWLGNNVYWTLDIGEKRSLLYNDKPIKAKCMYIWAKNKQYLWAEYKDQLLDLSHMDNDGTFTFTFNP